MIESIKLVTFYTLFAIIAIICNIVAQEVCGHIYNGQYNILVSIFFGTGIGLLVKYFFDKKYIFKYKTNGSKHNGKVFLIYVIMGGLTTIIFWGFEFGFYYLFKTKEMRYVGGIIGLIIGYICKYYLDKRFVFRTV